MRKPPRDADLQRDWQFVKTLVSMHNANDPGGQKKETACPIALAATSLQVYLIL